MKITKTLTLGALAIAILSSANVANAGKLHIKNCSAEKVYVCIYDKKDNTGWIPRNIEKFESQEDKDMGCKGDRCRIRVTDKKDSNENCNDSTAYKIKSKNYVSINWADNKVSEVEEHDSKFLCSNS